MVTRSTGYTTRTTFNSKLNNLRHLFTGSSIGCSLCTLHLLDINKEKRHLAQECLFYYYYFWTHEHKISLQAKKKYIANCTQPASYRNMGLLTHPEQFRKSTSYCYRHTSSPNLIKYNFKHYKSNNIETKVTS